MQIENLGPMESIDIKMPFDKDGKPTPLLIVGENGAGKSIFVATLMNAILSTEAGLFEDSFVSPGKVFKLRSTSYIARGKSFSHSSVTFVGGFQQSELQLNSVKSEYEKVHGALPYQAWLEMNNDEASSFVYNRPPAGLPIKKLFDEGVILYFPPNRFEEPAWLNAINLRGQASYTKRSGLNSQRERSIVATEPLKDNVNWFLDIVYDAQTIETTYASSRPTFGIAMVPTVRRSGPATTILENISGFLKQLFKFTGTPSYSLGRRGFRSIGITANGKVITDNLFQLSSGEAILLDLYLTILRDGDSVLNVSGNAAEAKGLVVIDEADIHLHSSLQHDILPWIIGQFPNIQFIITTHSPLFIMGMATQYGEDSFSLIELPRGSAISSERFTEYEQAFSYFETSRLFEERLKTRLESSTLPQVFVEGSTDVDYIRAAAKTLNREDLIDQVELLDANGVGGLNSIAKSFSSEASKTFRHKVGLLYDCDAHKASKDEGLLRVRGVESLDNPIAAGIENLFGRKTLERAITHSPRFIDKSPSYEQLKRGETVFVAEEWKVNPDEKRNLCNWVCKNGTPDDFSSFAAVFDQIESMLR